MYLRCFFKVFLIIYNLTYRKRPKLQFTTDNFTEKLYRNFLSFTFLEIAVLFYIQGTIINNHTNFQVLRI